MKSLRCYFVQHGLAKPADADPLRPLSAEGRQATTKIAWALQRGGLRPVRICHSGKLRALQTAEILAAELGAELLARDDMKPKSDPLKLSADLQDETLYVGHLPHLQSLVDGLLGLDEGRSVLRLSHSATLCLQRDAADGAWRIAWHLTPEIC